MNGTLKSTRATAGMRSSLEFAVAMVSSDIGLSSIAIRRCEGAEDD
jgi:hypothetical protein